MERNESALGWAHLGTWSASAHLGQGAWFGDALEPVTSTLIFGTPFGTSSRLLQETQNVCSGNQGRQVLPGHRGEARQAWARSCVTSTARPVATGPDPPDSAYRLAKDAALTRWLLHSNLLSDHGILACLLISVFKNALMMKKAA